jgi:hypothetical protein
MVKSIVAIDGLRVRLPARTLHQIFGRDKIITITFFHHCDFECAYFEKSDKNVAV